MVQRPGVVVEAEQERADALAVLVQPEPGDDAVGGAVVLDLPEHALVTAVGEGRVLGDDAVEAGSFEPLEPVGGDGAVGRDRCEMDGRLDARHRLLEEPPSLREGLLEQRAVAEREEVEGDEGRRRLTRQLAHPATPPGAAGAGGRRSRGRRR